MFNDAVYIPRLLDAPERFVFLSAFEVVAIFGGLMMGQMTGQWVFSLVLSAVLFYYTRKADQKGYFEALGYIVYWYMPDAFLKPMQMNYFKVAPSYKRELVG